MLRWFVSPSHAGKRWTGTRWDCASLLRLSHPPLILPGFGLREAFPRKGSLGLFGEPLTFVRAPSPHPLGPELSTGQAAGQTDRARSDPQKEGWRVGCCLRALGALYASSTEPQPYHPALSPMFFSLRPCRLQARYHLCAAGWLDGERVGYPTAFSSPNCGSGYVGIVDYGRRVNLSETWDVFCYREKGKRVPCCVPLRKGEQQPGFRFLRSATGCQVTLQVTPSLFNFKKNLLPASCFSGTGQVKAF